MKIKFQYIKWGMTRQVFLVGNYAFKIPTFRGWNLFTKGLLDNMNEGTWKEFNSPDLAKIHYSNKFGMLNIMERIRPVKNESLYRLNLTELLVRSSLANEFIMSDAKSDNFGFTRENNFVKCDYG